MTDIGILRKLAAEYAAVAFSEENFANMALHRAVNDLRGSRPIVLIDEIPWHEMQVEDELTLRCADEDFRRAEWQFRTALYRWRYMRADMIVPPYYGVAKRIHTSGNGLTRIVCDAGAKADSVVQAHTFQNQIRSMEDLHKLHNEVVTYDKESGEREMEKLACAIGDILPVKLTGTAYMGCTTWDNITNYCGLDRLFLDLVDQPALMHALAAKLTDIFLDKVRQYEQLQLFEPQCYSLHCTAGLTNDLQPDFDRTKPNQIWGRGAAQILGSVSPAMHEEFDIQYMARAMAPFGLTYYGCCEPLDGKIDIVEKLPHLRKISVTPWANVDAACEQIGGRYVVASKPNPAAVAVRSLDEDALKKELKRIVCACRRNGCSCDMVLKDITTVCGKPQTLWRWQALAMQAVQ